MKKLFAIVATLLTLTGSAFGQTSIGAVRPLTTTATLSASNAGTCFATGVGCVVLNTGGYTGHVIQVTGNASANTLQFEVTADPSPSGSSVWVSISAFPSNSTTSVTSTTSTGAWYVAGVATAIRVRCSTFVGGTAVVTIRSTLSARGGGGGGAGGGASFPLLAPDGSAPAPSYAFSNDPDTGMYRNGSDSIGLAAGGFPMAGVTTGGTVFRNDGMIGFAPGGTLTVAAATTTLFQDASDVLAQRRGTNPQGYNSYNTFTDTGNYERAFVGWVSNVFTIDTRFAGTGTGRGVDISIANAAKTYTFRSSALTLPSGVNLLFATDNTADIGATGATRPHDYYGGGAIRQLGGTTTVGTTGVPIVVAAGRSTAQNAAVASVSTFTVGAADASFEVSANVLVTTATNHTFTVTCAYTDEGNTARTVTMTFRLIASPTTLTTSVTNTNGAVPYNGDTLHIRAKASTAITIATTGTFTTVTYNVEGIIRKLS